jgi:hypothetical protein
MMDASMWSVIAQVIGALLIPLMGALGLWATGQVKRMQARNDLKTMKQNAIDAVEAIEQLYKDRPNEEKRAMALQLAQQLNVTAGITTPDSTQLMLNEASVFTLPKAQG